jgi:ATP-dependent protease ClpP protease subunit
MSMGAAQLKILIHQASLGFEGQATDIEIHALSSTPASPRHLIYEHH